MSIIHGQIGSLKTLREKLNSKGIERFNSIADINLFLHNYISERDEIYAHHEINLDNEITSLEKKIANDEDLLSKTKEINKQSLEIQIKQINSKIEIQKFKDNTFFISRILTKLYKAYLKKSLVYLDNNRAKIENKNCSKVNKSIEWDKNVLNKITNNKGNIIEERSAFEINHLNYTKEAVKELKPFIAGAIGENLVSNEIKNLTVQYTLINDFTLKFDNPIYNRSENDRIYSIQIDHLLITKAGIFILETKNWSKKSIESLDLRSPIKQIKRFNFALFMLLHNGNSKYKIYLDKHHWGDKLIPIKNLIVMINNKPIDQFPMVKVITVNELNNYVRYFEPVFNDSEYAKISETLVKMNDKETLK